MNKNLLLLCILFIFIGCSRNIPNLNERKATALSLIDYSMMKENLIYTSSFNFFTLQNNLEKCKNIKVYIEGDGLAWITRHKISSDPTPINPMGLNLMNTDTSKCKIYIARPCQYTKSDNCKKKYWTSHRFNEEVIVGFQEVLNKIKIKNKNDNFTLIGYSGGGAIATLLSAKRDDVKKLITIAGNLDTKKWTTLHNISPLNDSYNPADFYKELENVEQLHIIGSQDKIIPKEIFFSYISKFQKPNNIKYKIVDMTHNTGVVKEYAKILKEENGKNGK
jgi:hypothetical protein